MRGQIEKGLVVGAGVGVIVGLIPGILLVLVAYGGSYGLTSTDIFTFIIMSIIGITLAGAIVGVVHLYQNVRTSDLSSVNRIGVIAYTSSPRTDGLLIEDLKV